MNELQEEAIEDMNELQEEAIEDIEHRHKAVESALKVKRGFRPEAHRRHRQRADRHELGEGYDTLPTLTGWIATDTGFVLATIDYSKLYQIAKSFAIKAKVQDQQDLLHDIIEGLAKVAMRKLADGQDFTEPAMVRTAEHIKDSYWYKRYAYYYGIDCHHCSKEQRAKCRYNWAHSEWAYTDCHRAIQLESLNQPITDKEGNLTELGNLSVDDNALDLEAWLEAKTFLIGAPIRLKSIVLKRSNGQALSGAERKYLAKLRKREQKVLF
jgi:hypothetical protein